MKTLRECERARPKLPNFGIETAENLPDPQKCVGFKNVEKKFKSLNPNEHWSATKGSLQYCCRLYVE